MTKSTPYEEPTEYYQSASNPHGLDSDVYKVMQATFDFELRLGLQGDVDVSATGLFRLLFVEDLTQDIDPLARFAILEWEDLGPDTTLQPLELQRVAPARLEASSWTTILSAYRVTSPEYFCAPQSPEEVIDDLAEAYRLRRLKQFEALLPDGSDAPEYEFHVDPSASSGTDQWGYSLESHIHQRMFEPQNTPAGQSPVPVEYWLMSISIALTQATAFTEENDMYVSPQNPDGLDPTRWKAMGALYATDVLFDTQGALDFQVSGRAYFVVLEDLEKSAGEGGRFLLFQWFDLGTARQSSAKEQSSWSTVKALYN